mmetsp:Transcript_86304/g.239317  ORF Transcript_86304/g.239317 Transcript_86304/m.239317 type:complete len:242 (-) Transcript_86304:236-961(-)
MSPSNFSSKASRKSSMASAVFGSRPRRVARPPPARQSSRCRRPCEWRQPMPRQPLPKSPTVSEPKPFMSSAMRQARAGEPKLFSQCFRNSLRPGSRGCRAGGGDQGSASSRSWITSSASGTPKRKDAQWSRKRKSSFEIEPRPDMSSASKTRRKSILLSSCSNSRSSVSRKKRSNSSKVTRPACFLLQTFQASGMPPDLKHSTTPWASSSSISAKSGSRSQMVAFLLPCVSAFHSDIAWPE